MTRAYAPSHRRRQRRRALGVGAITALWLVTILTRADFYLHTARVGWWWGNATVTWNRPDVGVRAELTLFPGWWPIAPAWSSGRLACPIALVLPACLCGWLVLCYLDERRAVRRGLCPGCGYDLARLAADRCPECGRPTAREQSPA